MFVLVLTPIHSFILHSTDLPSQQVTDPIPDIIRSCGPGGRRVHPDVIARIQQEYGIKDSAVFYQPAPGSGDWTGGHTRYVSRFVLPLLLCVRYSPPNCFIIPHSEPHSSSRGEEKEEEGIELPAAGTGSSSGDDGECFQSDVSDRTSRIQPVYSDDLLWSDGSRKGKRTRDDAFDGGDSDHQYADGAYKKGRGGEM